jgi:hypothetical protein
MSTPITCLAPALTANLEISLECWKRKAKEDDVHGKNRGSAADIEDNLVFEQVLVLHDSIHIGACSDFIFLGDVREAGDGRGA